MNINKTKDHSGELLFPLPAIISVPSPLSPPPFFSVLGSLFPATFSSVGG